MMLFDARLQLREKLTGVSTDVDIRLQVDKTDDGYTAYNPVASALVGRGTSPQGAILDYLNQQLHRVEAVAFNQQREVGNSSCLL